MKGIWSKTIPPALGVAAAMLAAPGSAWPQTTPFERLSAEQFDATPPSALVHGAPGRMSVRSTACRDLPAGETRRRIVDIAAQEWAFFGFYVIDQTGPSTRTRSSRGSRRWWWRPANAAEGVRMAPTIAGYWAATPRGPWMIARQNGRWNGPGGLTPRWRDPCSAALISWVLCERGLGSPDRLDFTVIAPTVNVASRVQELCKPLGEPVLVTSAVAERSGETLRSLGVHPVKGLAAPIEAFALRAADGSP